MRTVAVDRAGYVARAPRPAVRADALDLPFRAAAFDGAAALWMLYHLVDPLPALREVCRVLRPGGPLAVSAPSHRNDPELADVLPGWGRPLSFDAENAVDQVGHILEVVDVQRWDEPSVRLPDAGADALTATKRGLVCWARKPGPAAG